MWYEWNVNANDVMMMRFALYVNSSDVSSGMCNMHMHACMVHMLQLKLVHLSNQVAWHACKPT